MACVHSAKGITLNNIMNQTCYCGISHTDGTIAFLDIRCFYVTIFIVSLCPINCMSCVCAYQCILHQRSLTNWLLLCCMYSISGSSLVCVIIIVVIVVLWILCFIYCHAMCTYMYCLCVRTCIVCVYMCVCLSVCLSVCCVCLLGCGYVV